MGSIDFSNQRAGLIRLSRGWATDDVFEKPAQIGTGDLLGQRGPEKREEIFSNPSLVLFPTPLVGFGVALEVLGSQLRERARLALFDLAGSRVTAHGSLGQCRFGHRAGLAQA